VWDGFTGYPENNVSQLESHLLVQLNAARAMAIPVWVGEFGIGDGVTNHDQWIRDHVALYQKYDLGYCWWEYWVQGGATFSSTYNDYTWKPWIALVASP